MCQALNTGVDPAYIVIARTMPRYEASMSQCHDLWVYLSGERPMSADAMKMDKLGRRRLLVASAAAVSSAAIGSWPSSARASAATFGPVRPPLAGPTMALTDSDGKPAELSQLLRGHVTALQLMFTGCSATCPIQGAIFSDLQHQLDGADRSLRLLSVSIDPLTDDAATLQTWLARFGAKPQRWSAAVPKVADVDRLIDYLRGRALGPDRHTAQTFLFGRKGDLVYRTADMPPAAFIAGLMKEMLAMT